MIINNVNVLAFYNSIEQKNVNKWWVDDKFSLCTPNNYLIPFQIPKYANANPITVFELYKSETDVLVDDLRVECETKGLDIAAYNDYDLMYYPSHIPLDNDYKGFHYLKISDGTTTYYSDDFNFTNIDAFIKLEYWHCRDLKYDGGHFRYDIPYKNRVYFCTDIGKPTYPYEEIASKRKGYKYFIEQISYKLNKFSTFVPEYLADALRLVRMHDYLEITYNNEVIEVDEFIMPDPKWTSKGDLGELVFQFKSNTVVAVNGKAYESCSVLCVVPTIQTEAILLEGSNDYNNREYLDINGDLNYFEAGQYFIIINSSNKYELAYYDGFVLTLKDTLPNGTYYNKGDDTYWMGASPTDGQAEVIKPYIIGVTNNRVTGLTFSDSIFVEVIALVNNVETVVGQGTYADLTGSGIYYEGNYDKLKIKSSNKNCYRFSTSNWFNTNLNGIGVQIIETSNIIG